jgi:hypothetical protein
VSPPSVAKNARTSSVNSSGCSFAAMEQPELFTDDVRAFFATLDADTGAG